MSETLFDPNLYNVGSGETILSRLTNLATGSLQTGVGFALGFAAATALQPLATSIAQEAYHADPSKVLDPHDLAVALAQTLIDHDKASDAAKYSGIGTEPFDLLYETQIHVPPTGELLDFLRRKTVTDADFTHALRKMQLDPRYDAAIKQRMNLPLGGAEIANAIHRGNMTAPSIFPFPAPTAPGSVPQYPVSKLDPFEQAAWGGTSPEQLEVLVANAGLPLGLMQMLTLRNRGKVTDDDVKRAIAHSNIRNEYMDVALDLARYILSPTEYADLRLRGWIDDAAMYAGGALHGVEQSDMDLLVKSKGRPVVVHQVNTGLARGGEYNGPTAHIPEAFIRSLEQGSIRPEWYNIAYANRYTIPSYFILKQILADGGLTEPELGDLFKQEGWPPDLADKAAAAIAGGGTSGTGPYTKKAESQLWTATHKAYVDAQISEAEATASLTALGATADDIAGVLSLWKLDAKTPRKTLTVKQITDAIGEPGKDAAWANTRLIDLGYTTDDAATILYSPPAGSTSTG